MSVCQIARKAVNCCKRFPTGISDKFDVPCKRNLLRKVARPSSCTTFQHLISFLNAWYLCRCSQHMETMPYRQTVIVFGLNPDCLHFELNASLKEWVLQLLQTHFLGHIPLRKHSGSSLQQKCKIINSSHSNCLLDSTEFWLFTCQGWNWLICRVLWIFRMWKCLKCPTVGLYSHSQQFPLPHMETSLGHFTPPSPLYKAVSNLTLAGGVARLVPLRGWRECWKFLKNPEALVQ